MYGEIKQINHKWYMYDAATDAEDAGEESYQCTAGYAEWLVVAKGFRIKDLVCTGFMLGIPIHDAAHEQQKDTKIEIQHLSVEFVGYI